MSREKAPKQRVDIYEKYKRMDPEFIPSGILYIDILLGGGIPRGSFIELCSPSGLGKSSIMAHISKNMCADGLSVLWLDYEQALTSGLKRGTGVEEFEGNKFIHLTPITYGDGEEILENLDPANLPDLVVVDSITSMLPDKQQEGTILSEQPGVKARLESMFLIKYKGWARKSGVTFVFINQMRTKIGNMFQVVDDSAGGNSFKFYCDCRLRMKKGRDIEKEEMTIEGKKKITYGAEVIIWAIKNRGERSHVEMTLPIIFGKGVSNLLIFKNVLIGADLVTSAGSFFKVNLPGIYEGTVQGNKGLIEIIRTYYSEILNYIKVNNLVFLVRSDEDNS